MKIRRLNFIEKNGGFEARTAIANYFINVLHMLVISTNDGATWADYKTEEDAKEHAQRDFEQRIMAYIE